MISLSSNVSLFSLCLDSLSVFDNGVLKSSSVIEVVNLWIQISRQCSFYEIVFGACMVINVYRFSFLETPLLDPWVRSDWVFENFYRLSPWFLAVCFNGGKLYTISVFLFTGIWLVVHTLLCGRGSKPSCWRDSVTLIHPCDHEGISCNQCSLNACPRWVEPVELSPLHSLSINSCSVNNVTLNGIKCLELRDTLSVK